MAKTLITTKGDRDLLRDALDEFCIKSGFPDKAKLGQRDLTFLCELIELKSGVSISLSTMKRLMNEQFSNLPQIATLNAIAACLGYKNWLDFKLSKASSIECIHDTNGAIIKISNLNPVGKKKSFTTTPLIIGAVLIVSSIALIAIFSNSKNIAGNIETAQFSATKATSNSLPNTVIFHYNVENVKADSFFIQQSWDKHRRVKIDKRNHTLTDIYYEPGYHTAKLIANDQVIKTFDVKIPTDRWFYYAKDTLPKSIPRYIKSTGYKNGYLQMYKAEVLNSGVNVEKPNDYFNAYFPSKIEYNSDSFDLKCRIKVNIIKAEACPYLMCEVNCQKQFMFFVTYPAGCSNKSQAQFGEVVLKGRTTDLSAMGVDITTWHDFEFIVNKRKVSIQIDHKEVFRTEYQRPCGLITGMNFVSNGLCQIDFVDMKTMDGKVIYNNDFNKPEY